MGVEADKALVIPVGDSYMIVPIPRGHIEFDLKETVKAAKEKAEKRLADDVRTRAQRRRAK